MLNLYSCKFFFKYIPMLQTCKNHRIDLNFVRVFTHISSYPFNIKQQQINLASFPKRFDFIISLCSTFYTLIITFKANRKNLTQTQIWFLTVLYIVHNKNNNCVIYWVLQVCKSTFLSDIFCHNRMVLFQKYVIY